MLGVLASQLVKEASSSTFDVVDLRTEYLSNPLGLDVEAPRFSWQVAPSANSTIAISAVHGVHQDNYRILARTEAGASVWDSGVVPTPHAVAPPSVSYGGPKLDPGGVYCWTVETAVTWVSAAGGDGGGGGAENEEGNRFLFVTETAASEEACFSVGLPLRSDWTAKFIALPASNSSSNFAPDPWFRKTFTLPAAATVAAAAGSSALLHVASVGYCEASVNSQPASSSAVLVPSISYLPSRILYRTYNVSKLLNFTPGATNVVGLWAAAGWADYGDFSWAADSRFGGHAPLVMAELHVGGTVVKDSVCFIGCMLCWQHDNPNSCLLACLLACPKLFFNSVSLVLRANRSHVVNALFATGNKRRLAST